MQQALYKMTTVSIISLLAMLLGISYFQNSSDKERLSNRLSVLENGIKHSAPVVDRETPTEASNELAVLQAQISQLQNQLNQIHPDTNKSNSRQSAIEDEKLASTDTQRDYDKTDLKQESEVFNTIKNTGYLYEEDWNDLQQKLDSMDKHENKLFWQKMASAIENKEIEMYSER